MKQINSKNNFNLRSRINSLLFIPILLLFLLASNSIFAAKNVLIYGPKLVSSTPNEQTLAVAAGHNVTVVSDAQWSAMSTSQFAAYDAIIIPDDGCSTYDGNGSLTNLNANKSTWSPAITGKRFYFTADGTLHRQGQYEQLITNGINFVANGGGTGIYYCSSCSWCCTSASTVDFLSMVDNISIQPAGADNVNILQSSHPTMSGISNSGLSNWGSTAHGQFSSFPSSLLTIATVDGVAMILASSSCSATSCSISVTPSSETNTGGVNTNLYIGYPTNNPSATLATSGGTTTTWSPSTYLSCSSCTSTAFTPTAAGNYTITGINCFDTCTVTICVKDIRVPNTSGTKAAVYMCHKEPGTTTTKTLAVLLRGIPSHFQYHSGDKLGVCGNTCATNKRDFEFETLVVDEQYLEVMCSPNPFRQSFKLHYISNSEEEATVAIYGMTGNLVETVTLAGVADEAELGSNLPNGIYTVSFIQGDKNRVFRMIKVD